MIAENVKLQPNSHCVTPEKFVPRVYGPFKGFLEQRATNAIMNTLDKIITSHVNGLREMFPCYYVTKIIFHFGCRKLHNEISRTGACME